MSEQAQLKYTNKACSFAIICLVETPSEFGLLWFSELVKAVSERTASILEKKTSIPKKKYNINYQASQKCMVTAA